MAEGRRTAAVVGSSVGLLAGTAIGYFGRGFFENSKPQDSGTITPGGAASADAVATAQSGKPAQAVNPNAAIIRPANGRGIVAYVKENPATSIAAAVGIILVIRFLTK